MNGLELYNKMKEMNEYELKKMEVSILSDEDLFIDQYMINLSDIDWMVKDELKDKWDDMNPEFIDQFTPDEIAELNKKAYDYMIETQEYINCYEIFFDALIGLLKDKLVKKMVEHGLIE